MKTTQHIIRYFVTMVMTLLLYTANAQLIDRYNSFNYNVNEGLLQTTIMNMAFDKNNFCWISFPNGIQKFDGIHFTMVPIQAGLPDDKLVYLYTCHNGDLFLSHSGGISKYEISGNRFVQVYTAKAGEGKPAQFIGDEENVIYFFTNPGSIKGINCHTYQLVSEVNTGLIKNAYSSDYRPKISSNMINHRVAFEIQSAIYLWDLKKEKLISQSPVIDSMSRFFLVLKSENEVLYARYDHPDALLGYHFIEKTSRKIFIHGKAEKYMSRCIIYPWQNKILISFNNRLYETDTSFGFLKTELVNFQNQSMAGSSTISNIKEDNFGNLYLSTIMGGIKKVIRNNYPIKYYGTEKKENNNITAILTDKKQNRILCGTASNGVLVFDTLQQLIMQVNNLGGKKITAAVNTIIKNDRGQYLLFISGEKNVRVLNNDLTYASPLPIKALQATGVVGIDYFGNTLFRDDKLAITQSQGKIYTTHFLSKTITEKEVTTSYAMGGLLHKGYIITHANDELIFADTATGAVFKKVPFKNTGYVRCFAKDASDNIYVGSNNGIFIIDAEGKIIQHLRKSDGLPDECIYAMQFDQKGFLWCSTNKGIFKLGDKNNILLLKKDDGLQENEFNTNIVAKSEDGELFFGGMNGVSSFYPEAINSFAEKINLVVTNISINNEDHFKDTAVWNISKIEMPYYKNALSFDFIAMANNNPGQYIYQYRMDGVDEQWIQNNDMQTVRYHLQPGKYVFKMAASRFFDKDAKAMKEIIIHIHPPFWKTWWFRLLLSVMIISVVVYVLNQVNKRQYQKKLAQLESEHRVQLERERISRDLHDSIGAYANAVLYNTELLEQEKEIQLRTELMKDLKFASKDIITSLRETIWALKKDTYTASECLLRIRNFMQPFSRYYPNIQFKVEGHAPERKILHYTEALNLVRMVQEAVTNAIKHAEATQISVSSNPSPDLWEVSITDNGQGFIKESIMKSAAGNGLVNLQQRAKDSGFDLSIQTTPGNGTSIRIQIA